MIPVGTGKYEGTHKFRKARHRAKDEQHSNEKDDREGKNSLFGCGRVRIGKSGKPYADSSDDQCHFETGADFAYGGEGWQVHRSVA